MAKQSKGKQGNRLFMLGMVSVTAAVAVVIFLLLTVGRGKWQKGGAAASPGEPKTSLAVSVPSSLSSSASLPALPTGSVSAIEQPKDSLLVLVNHYNKMPDNYDQTLIEAYDMVMDERVRRPFEEMYNAAAKEGAILWISSSYRDPEKQEELYQREIQTNLSSGMSSEQAVAQANVAVARGGYSEHNTGLAIDLNGVRADFLETTAGKWMAEHAEEYGFVLRFPQGKEAETGIMYEPWHYRYVGKEHALKMKELGMCLEEYVDYVKQNGG